MKGDLYPLFLKLDGKRAVVVGGGPIGAHKAAELASAGARVVVISTRFTQELHAQHASGALTGALWPREGAPPQFDAHIERIERAFVRGDTKGALIVIAATGDPRVDDAVAADARAHGALVNVVDRPDACDFYAGAVVRRGPLAVVVGTGGASPALARKVRARIEQVLPETVGALAEALGRARPRLLARLPIFAERARVLDGFVDRMWFRFIAGPNVGDVKTGIEEAIERELLADDESSARAAAGESG